MKRYLMVMAIVTFLIPACCPMVSVNPLSEPAGLDEKLYGTWKPILKENDKAFLHIGKLTDNLMVALSVEHKVDGTLDTSRMPFFLTKTNSNNYWNVKLEDLDKEMARGNEGFFFLKYRFSDKDTLHIYQLEREPIISAIRQKNLKGKITYRPIIKKPNSKITDLQIDKNIDCVVISDSSENLLKYIESNSTNELFKEAMQFERLK